jgi:signal transduction histidine kinase
MDELELERADQESRSKEELLGAIKGALTTTQAISKLTENLFLLAVLDERGENAARESVDLVDLVYQSVSIREDLAQKKSVSIEVLGLSSAVIKANPMQIMFAIGNLLDNAIRHSPPQDKVIVTIEIVNDEFRISVSDQGEGFPPEFLPIAFDRFSRPDNARNRKDGGAGLGLAMVKAITEAHGGKADIASGNGIATTVSIWLPGAP